MLTEQKVRIGMVNFINTAPLYDVWLRTVNRPEWSVFEAAPAELNRMLSAGRLDMGLVSSQEYAAHPSKYLLLDDISISATGPVGSVFLFSKCTPESLAGRLVLLSGQSQTSVSLVKIILETFYDVMPRYKVGPALEARQNQDVAAVLAIGDEALILARSAVYPYKTDLGRIWHTRTSLPFVYAVWAMREEFCRRNPGTVRQIHRELLRCRQEGRDDLKNISRRAGPRVSMDADTCYEYLRGIEHYLGPEKKKGLELFIEYLRDRGESAPGSLPLRIFS